MNSTQVTSARLKRQERQETYRLRVMAFLTRLVKVFINQVNNFLYLLHTATNITIDLTSYFIRLILPRCIVAATPEALYTSNIKAVLAAKFDSVRTNNLTNPTSVLLQLSASLWITWIFGPQFTLRGGDVFDVLKFAITVPATLVLPSISSVSTSLLPISISKGTILTTALAGMASYLLYTFYSLPHTSGTSTMIMSLYSNMSMVITSIAVGMSAYQIYENLFRSVPIAGYNLATLVLNIVMLFGGRKIKGQRAYEAEDAIKMYDMIKQGQPQSRRDHYGSTASKVKGYLMSIASRSMFTPSTIIIITLIVAGIAMALRYGGVYGYPLRTSTNVSRDGQEGVRVDELEMETEDVTPQEVSRAQSAYNYALEVLDFYSSVVNILYAPNETAALAILERSSMKQYSAPLDTNVRTIRSMLANAPIESVISASIETFRKDVEYTSELMFQAQVSTINMIQMRTLFDSQMVALRSLLITPTLLSTLNFQTQEINSIIDRMNQDGKVQQLETRVSEKFQDLVARVERSERSQQTTISDLQELRGRVEVALQTIPPPVDLTSVIQRVNVLEQIKNELIEETRGAITSSRELIVAEVLKQYEETVRALKDSERSERESTNKYSDQIGSLFDRLDQYSQTQSDSLIQALEQAKSYITRIDIVLVTGSKEAAQNIYNETEAFIETLKPITLENNNSTGELFSMGNEAQSIMDNLAVQTPRAILDSVSIINLYLVRVVLSLISSKIRYAERGHTRLMKQMSLLEERMTQLAQMIQAPIAIENNIEMASIKNERNEDTEESAENEAVISLRQIIDINEANTNQLQIQSKDIVERVNILDTQLANLAQTISQQDALKLTSILKRDVEDSIRQLEKYMMTQFSQYDGELLKMRQDVAAQLNELRSSQKSVYDRLDEVIGSNKDTKNQLARISSASISVEQSMNTLKEMTYESLNKNAEALETLRSQLVSREEYEARNSAQDVDAKALTAKNLYLDQVIMDFDAKIDRLPSLIDADYVKREEFDLFTSAIDPETLERLVKSGIVQEFNTLVDEVYANKETNKNAIVTLENMMKEKSTLITNLQSKLAEVEANPTESYIKYLTPFVTENERASQETKTQRSMLDEYYMRMTKLAENIEEIKSKVDSHTPIENNVAVEAVDTKRLELLNNSVFAVSEIQKTHAVLISRIQQQVPKLFADVYAQMKRTEQIAASSLPQDSPLVTSKFRIELTDSTDYKERIKEIQAILNPNIELAFGASLRTFITRKGLKRPKVQEDIETDDIDDIETDDTETDDMSEDAEQMDN